MSLENINIFPSSLCESLEHVHKLSYIATSGLHPESCLLLFNPEISTALDTEFGSSGH